MKKRIPALLCALFIFIFLGSCGRGPEADKSVETDAETVSSGTEDALSASDLANANGAEDKPASRTVAIRVGLNETEADALQMLTEEFNAANAEGVTVVVVNEMPDTDADNPDAAAKEPVPEPVEGTEAVETAAADNGDAPVVLLLDDAKTIRATRGLQSLNERIAAEYGNDTDVPLSLRNETEYGGEQFGVPFDLDGTVYYFNADLFEENGLKAPETREAFMEAAQVLAKEEDLPTLVTDSLTDLADLMLRQSGVSLTEGNHAAFGNAKGEAVFEDLMTLLNEDGLLLADKGTCRDQFLAQQTAGYFGKGTDLLSMYRNTPFSIGAVALPAPETDGVSCAPCSMRVLAMLPADKEMQEAAWTFVRYLTSPSVSARWAVATGNFPVRSSAYLEPEFTSYMETSVAAKASTGAGYGYYLPGEYSEDLQYRVREIIGRNMKSNVTGKEVCEILTQEINDSLAQ